MRAVFLSCVLLFGLPVVSLAQEVPPDAAAAATPAPGLPKAQLEEIVELVDAWLTARSQDEQIRLQDIDESLTWWCRSALEDPGLQAAMAPKDVAVDDSKAARRKRRKAKARASADTLPPTDDLMDTSLRVDPARLGAVAKAVLDAQPRFARMEATGVEFMKKERQLKELRGLAQAELDAASAPPAPVATVPSEAAGASAGGPAPESPAPAPTDRERPALEDLDAAE